MLEAGQKAPASTLLDQDGEKVTLTDLKGRTVVLYFSPKAETPGVAPVIDAENNDLASLLVDPVEHAIGPATG